MAIESLNGAFFADPAALGAIRREAASQSPEALREAAKQFESLFTSMLLKSMRAASPGDPFASDQQDFYQDMFDQQLAAQLSKGKGLGLADVLVRQLMQGQGGDVVDGLAPGTTAPGGATAATNWPPKDADEFVRAIRPAATAAAKELGVDPDVVIAHAALETGWGRSVPMGADGAPSFNLFGIKAGPDWQGATATRATLEYAGGVARRETARFRAYSGLEETFEDYARLIAENPRYAAARDKGADTQGFARALAASGYATDPGYAEKITRVLSSDVLKSALDGLKAFGRRPIMPLQ